MTSTSADGAAKRNPGKYNRRQRKKLRIGEFIEYGFSVEAALRDPGDRGAIDAVLDDFIDFIEAHGLIVGGGVSDSLSFYVTSGGVEDPVTEAKREYVADWLAARAELSKVEVGSLNDAWNGHK